ncbi:cyclic nucleotide-binding domain-containing protein [Myxococcus sp. K15C18031901]|uniref:cyclic nucleotide-binding domain-containing protein n=1 Tax=Myxococcus dinghuensis TaxID=2906761 RepID=UPI0020A7E55F|nr:cyclic nucleotide-binding domain-containing protein [Myxococcus dinghuensis]MCP3103937.1 cyclic nucleotide-binding domain-containing protein [Myxococcus dinghuensis]
MEARQLKDKAAEAFTKGRFSRAAELYEDFCRLEPRDHQSRLRTGDAWAKAGERERAISAYHSAAEGFAKEGFLPRAIAASKLILELDPSHSGVQQMLADLYARRGTPAGARSSTASRGALSSAPPPEPPPATKASSQPVVAPGALETTPGSEPAGEEEVVHSVSVALQPGSGTADAPPSPVEIDLTLEADAPVLSAAPVASAPAPVVGSRREGSTLPPGLAPRAASREQPVSASGGTAAGARDTAAASRSPGGGRWQALSSNIADSAVVETPRVPTVIDPPSAPPAFAPPGLRPRRSDGQPPAGATAMPFREVSRELGASLRAVSGPSSFTELELEADSLLHAVELAAQAGLHQRQVDLGVAEEEEVFSLTEEVSSESPSLDALPAIPLFSDLPREAFIELFERCPLRRFGVGDRIIEQGSHGDAFYVICEGSVRVFRMEDGKRQELATLEGGAFFGEMALLSGAPRTASVEAASDDAQLLEISAPVLAGLSRNHPQVAKALKKFVRQRMLTNVMNTSALFRLFNRKDRRTLVERFRARDVERDAVIIRDGDRTDGLYVLLSGEVEVRKDGHLLTRLKEGDLFGEISLLQKVPATATVTSTRHTTLLRLPREDFDALISSHPQILVLVSELSDERLRRTEQVLGALAASAMESSEGDEDLILV